MAKYIESGSAEKELVYVLYCSHQHRNFKIEHLLTLLISQCFILNGRCKAIKFIFCRMNKLLINKTIQKIETNSLLQIWLNMKHYLTKITSDNIRYNIFFRWSDPLTSKDICTMSLDLWEYHIFNDMHNLTNKFARPYLPKQETQFNKNHFLHDSL